MATLLLCLILTCSTHIWVRPQDGEQAVTALMPHPPGGEGDPDDRNLHVPAGEYHNDPDEPGGPVDDGNAEHGAHEQAMWGQDPNQHLQQLHEASCCLTHAQTPHTCLFMQQARCPECLCKSCRAAEAVTCCEMATCALPDLHADSRQGIADCCRAQDSACLHMLEWTDN